jgi:hypothetical protein
MRRSPVDVNYGRVRGDGTPDWDNLSRSEYDHHAGFMEWVRTYRAALVLIGALILLLVVLLVLGSHWGTYTAT